jgi:hypothetical protein
VLPESENVQTLLTTAPTTQGPGIVKATKVGPAAQLPVSPAAVVAVGIDSTGPAPQMTFPPLEGVR